MRRRRSEACGDAELVSGGQADPLGQQEKGDAGERGWSPEPPPAKPRPAAGARLERATGEIITALHAAKQELAKEMEANLKQLKAVLQETQRIAKDMEAVLREAKAEPNPQQQARGDGQQGAQQGGQQKQAKARSDEDENADGQQEKQGSAQADEGWNPPSFKQSRRQPRGAWEPPGFDQEQPPVQ